MMIGTFGGRPHGPSDLLAEQVGQSQIKHDEIRVGSGGRFERSPAAVRHKDRVALELEIRANQVTDLPLIVDD